MKLSRASRRELKIPRLCSAMRKSSLVMQSYRENRKKMVRLDAGAEWSDNAADKRRPWNGIGLFRRVVLQALVNATPRALLSTWRRESKRVVTAAADWGNRQFEKIELGEHLRRWVDDALYWMGVMKVGITTPVDAERSGWRTFAGEAFACTVDPDDYICDIFARHFDELSFEGHRYRGSAEAANRLYRLRGDQKLSGQVNEQFNVDGDERVGMIGKGYVGGDHDEFGEMTDLWEMYLPAYKAVLTFRSVNGFPPASEDDLLESREYIGPECGMYHKLGFLWVPGNLFPRGPIMDLFPLDESINQQLRKLLRQAERFKQMNLYSGAASKDMGRIKDAGDGDDVQVDRLNEIKQWASSPPSAQLFGVTQAMMQLFNKLAGNLDTLGGLARMAGTAAQEQQLNANASGFVGSMSRAVTIATSKVMEGLFWYWWHDPSGVMRSQYNLQSAPDVGVTREVYPAGTRDQMGNAPEYTRDMSWYDLEVKVDPYSLSMDTPQSKLQQLMQALQTLVPVLPMVGQSGLAPDWRFFFEKFAEYTNNPDIAEMLHLQEPPAGEEEQGRNDTPTKPPVTNRTYTRKSESEATDEGQSKDMMQRLMGAGMNGAGEFGGESMEGFP